MKIAKFIFLLICVWLVQLYARPTFTYILQADKFSKSKAEFISQISKCNRNYVIIDYSFDGSKNGIWHPNEIAAMKQGNKDRKIIAYLSIGEAENYRPYWRNEWLKSKRPDFLLEENPKWKGNYRVRFWDKSWKNVIMEYLDTIIKQGFDGVYLDVVDVYESFENGRDMRINPATQRPYREDMKRFVREIVKYGKRGNSKFIIFQQNALSLLADNAYVKLLDGIGAEDVFTDGNRAKSEKSIKESLRYLKKAQSQGLAIMVVEYAKQAPLQALVRNNAAVNDLDVLLTTKQLNVLGTFVMIKDSPLNEGDAKGGKSSTRRQAIFFSSH